MREDVLRRELNDLVEDLPEVEQVGVSDDEGGEEPVAEMDDVVMVHVIPDVVPLEFAVVVVGVHLRGHGLVEARVEEAKHATPEVGAHVEHENDEGHVDDR